MTREQLCERLGIDPEMWTIRDPLPWMKEAVRRVGWHWAMGTHRFHPDIWCVVRATPITPWSCAELTHYGGTEAEAFEAAIKSAIEAGMEVKP